MADRALRDLLSDRRYALYLCSRIALIMCSQMLSVAVGWQVYEITGQALALGLTGLALFLPLFFLSLPAGHVADRVNRRTILLVCHTGVTASAFTLAYMALSGMRALAPIYGIFALLGAIRAFSGPASQALLPNLVPRASLERAIAVGSSGFQFAMIAGPSVGGLLYALTGRAGAVYLACGLLATIAVTCVFLMGKVPETKRDDSKGAGWNTVLAGLTYVWQQKPLLGAISLDLFAVLLGGAVALLPVFARDFLHVGPQGMGLLRSAPAIGAATVALLIARFPLRRRAGVAMFACVFLFGIATIVFGTSRSFPVSLAALFVLGGADMISVVVRSTLVQIRTPDEMRGRVGAVNLVFIGASNELGEFESGVTAAWLGPELAVVLGGVGTCLVVVIWALLFPALRKVDRLDA